MSLAMKARARGMVRTVYAGMAVDAPTQHDTLVGADATGEVITRHQRGLMVEDRYLGVTLLT